MRDKCAPAPPDTSEPTTVHQAVGTASHGHYSCAGDRSLLQEHSPELVAAIGCNNSGSVPELHREVLPFRKLSLWRLVTHLTTRKTLSSIDISELRRGTSQNFARRMLNASPLF